jgi:hypothetical protein
MHHPLAKNLEELEQVFKIHNIHQFYEVIKSRIITKLFHKIWCIFQCD